MRIASILALAALLAAPAAALADEPASSLPPDSTLIHLSQAAQRQVVRDRLTVDMRVEVNGGDPKATQAEVNRRMSAALTAAKNVASVKPRTGEYATYRTTPTGPDGKPKGPPQFRSTESLSLTGEAFDDLLALTGELENQGLLMSGMHFDVRPETLRSVEDDLTTDALNRMTERSRNIAATLGMHVARVREITIGNAEQAGGIRPMMAAGVARAEAPPPPAAAAGESTVSLTLNADVILLPGK